MSSSLRTISHALTAVLLVSATASAQDRLFTLAPDGRRVVEIGAIGRFGQVLGPAPTDVSDFPERARLYAFDAKAVTDVATGAVIWTANDSEIIGGLAAAHDRSRIFVQTTEWSPPPALNLTARLRALDGASGVPRAEVLGDYSSLTWDPVGRRVLAWDWRRRLFDVFTDDLSLLGRFTLGSGSRCLGPSVMVSPHTGRAYIAYTDATHDYGTNFLNVLAVDLRDSRIVSRAVIGNTGNLVCPAVRLWSGPAAPAGLSASVIGHDVTVSWIPADFSAGYVVDAGVGRGRTDATFFVGQATRVRFHNVPSGTYYVRVRAGNRMGGGRPSNEVTVVVP